MSSLTPSNQIQGQTTVTILLNIKYHQHEETDSVVLSTYLMQMHNFNNTSANRLDYIVGSGTI